MKKVRGKKVCTLAKEVDQHKKIEIKTKIVRPEKTFFIQAVEPEMLRLFFLAKCYLFMKY